MEEEELRKLAKSMRHLADRIEEALGDKKKPVKDLTKLHAIDGLCNFEIASSVIRGKADESRVAKRRFAIVKQYLWKYVANTYFTYNERTADGFFKTEAYRAKYDEVLKSIEWTLEPIRKGDSK